MFKRIDQSSRFGRMLESLSSGLAKRRGLPIIIGIGLVIVAFIAQILNLLAPSSFWEWLWAISLHVGLITALIGIVVAEPLGR
ncbi:MAG: hypothetical protein UZ15_CFX003000992 [Chloroflexi bacterium OLB15]|nr:MAG: hypothetical protein UZ15_CFX003000992 [Chloroflexi bacterium OLB15]